MSVIKELSFDDLMKSVKEASIGRSNVNEVDVNTSLFFDGAEIRDDQAYAILKSEKGKRYSLHLLSFCNMKTTDAPDSISADWSADLLRDSSVATLQDAMLSGAVTGFEKGMEFKVVKRVKIQDSFHPGKAQLRPTFYKGFGDYSTANSTAGTIEDAEKRRAQFQTNRIELYKSGVNNEADYSNEKNIMYVPVFQIKAKS